MRGGRRAGAGEQGRREQRRCAGEQDSYAMELNGTSGGTAWLCRERGQTTRDDKEGFYSVLQLRRGSNPPRSYGLLRRPDANAMEDAAPSLLRSVPPTPWRTPLHSCSSLKVHFCVFFFTIKSEVSGS